MQNVGFLWNATQKYSVFSDAYYTGCRTDGYGGAMTVPPGYKKILITTATYYTCSWETVIRNARFWGIDIIAIVTNQLSDEFAESWGGNYQPQLGDPLLTFFSNTVASDQWSVSDSLRNPYPYTYGRAGPSLGQSPAVGAIFNGISIIVGTSGLNFSRWFWPFGPIEVFLEEPPSSETGLTMQIGYQGSFVNGVLYWSITANLIMLMVTTAKLYLFLHAQQSFKLTLPIMVIGICWLASFFYLFQTVFRSSDALPANVRDGLGSLVWPLLWSACMILGFYFGEVALLTSSSATTNVLGKMLIPAIISMTVVWGIFLGLTIYLNFLGAYKDTEQILFILFQGSLTSYANTLAEFQATVSFVCIGICVAILAFGSISIIIGARGMTNDGAKAIWIIAGLSVFILLCVSGFGLFYWSNYFTTSRFGWSNGFTIVYSQYLWRYLIPSLHHFFIVMALCFAFRLSLEKEIEVSKSGTSSTSGSMSGSGSSSSSSSSANRDPVIEL